METQIEPRESSTESPGIERKRARRDVDDREEHRFGRPPEGLPLLREAPPTRVTDTTGVELQIIELANKKDRARFIDMALPLYAGDPCYVPPLRMERMKFLDPGHNRAFANLDVRPILALRDGKVVGRMTAHIDRAYDAYHGSKTGWFGFFECIDDEKVAHAMLADGVEWLRQKGATEVFGPNNFTTNHTCGLLVENWDRIPYIEMTYNPRYYERLLTSFGLGKAKDLYAWWIDVSAGLENEKVARVARIAEKIKRREGITIRTGNMADFRNEVARLFSIYNQAWEKNWGFVQIAKEEFDVVADELKQVVRPELVIFIEVEGRPVAFACTIPNINEIMPRNGKLFPFGWWKLLTGMKKIKYARLVTLGVIPEYRKRGLEAMLFVETVVQSKKLGMQGGEIGWTLEDNDLVNRAIESMDGKKDRTYRILGGRL
ncbi:N-acetyltransferase [Myxococcota bacterium]|nr:N-acetyltransferase [Myxococcota bacterium]